MSYTFELNNERKDANFVSGKVNGYLLWWKFSLLWLRVGI